MVISSALGQQPEARRERHQPVDLDINYRANVPRLRGKRRRRNRIPSR